MDILLAGSGSVVAITGGMGTGKSSVVRYLCGISGAEVFDADAVCRRLLAPEAPGWLAIRAAFGQRFFLADQSVDRILFRKAIFADQEIRKAVDALLHPLARLQLRTEIREQTLRNPGGRIIVEVPLLYEAGWQDEYSRVVVVYAGAAVCRRRLVARDGIGPEEAAQAMAAQMGQAEKVLLADHVIDNSGAWADACLQVHHLSRVLWPTPAGVFL